MKNIIKHQKVFLIILLTVFLVFGVQGVSDAFFWEIIEALGEAFGAVGEAIGAVGEAIGIIVNVVADAVVIAADAINLSVRLIGTAVWDTGSLSNAHTFPDGGLVGVVISNLIYIWNPHTGQLHATLPHDALIRDISVNPDGNTLASGSIDGTLQLWNPHTETLRAVLRGDADGGIWSVAFSPDGSLLASGSADGTLQLWDPHTETSQAVFSGHTNSGVLSVAFSPDGLLLASGNVDGTIRLWNPRTRALENTIHAHADSVLNIAFSPDGSLLATASADGTVELWVAHTRQHITTLDHQAPVLSIAFNPDGSLLASGSVDGTARLWDPDTGKVQATLGHASPVMSVAFSPDGSILISGSEDGKARKWEVTTGSESGTRSAGHKPEPVITPTDSPESVTISTPEPLTESTLHESVVTLKLNERTYARSIFDIRDAVKVSGIDGVTIPWHDPDRKSDTEITIELEFNGNIDTDATLTFTVGAGAIANYNGPAATAQIPVTAVTESVVATTTEPLAEATLDGSVVTLTLNGAKFADSIFDIRDAVTVSGINGVTIPWHQPRKTSDTQITIELVFSGDLDTNATLTFTVNAGAIAGYGGPALTAEVPVSGAQESVVASTPAPLTEATLDESVVTLILSGRKFARSIFDIRDAVKVSGINGVTIPWHQPRKTSDTEITIELEFNGNMNTDGTLTFTVGPDAIANYNGSELTAQVTVTADRENGLQANFPNPFNPETWIPYQLAKPTEVTITIHAINGKRVRTLALGHQPAGIYQNRSRAAYWDGKNEFGEPVASGVYFYTLTAGDFTATRKMLIRK